MQFSTASLYLHLTLSSLVQMFGLLIMDTHIILGSPADKAPFFIRFRSSFLDKIARSICVRTQLTVPSHTSLTPYSNSLQCLRILSSGTTRMILGSSVASFKALISEFTNLVSVSFMSDSGLAVKN